MNPGREARDAARQQRADEEARQARIKAGMGNIDTTFKGFDEKFYGGVRQAQLDFLLPKLRTQFGDQREQLSYALARGGVLNSTIASRRNARLLEDYQGALTQADSAAEQAVKQARSDVENERSSLVSMLQATADPELAASTAANRARFLSAPQPIRDLGIVLQNAASGLGAATQPRYDAYGSRTGGGLSFGFTNRSRTVG